MKSAQPRLCISDCRKELETETETINQSKRMNLKFLTSIATLTLALSAALQAADTVKYEAQAAGSEMKLDGDSTAHKWTCIGKIISGSFEVESAWQKDLSLKSVTCLGPGKTAPKCEVKVPVRALKSQVSMGSSIMDSRMQAEMNIKQFPMIEYRLTEMTIKGDVPATGSPVTFDTTGQLVVCGVTNKVSFPVTMERVGADGLKFAGVLETKMSTLGVKPPEFTVLGIGMRAHDPIKLTWNWALAIKKD
jgi:hypothetical protein